MKQSSPAPSTTRIWDLPTRLFHVGFACSVIGAIVTAKIGNTWMDWHVRLGITALAMLTFRIIWGLIGPRYARFTQFVCGPVTIWRYLSTITQHQHKTPGHNPLGALSVIAMLAIIGVQAVSGLFANDDILTQGPFAQFVSDSTSSLMTGVHQFNEKLVFLVIGMHLIAIFVYTVKGQKLITPMICGDVFNQNLPLNTPAARDDWSIRIAALILAATLAYAAWWLIQLAAHAGASFN